jgi:hypothetical protein
LKAADALQLRRVGIDDDDAAAACTLKSAGHGDLVVFEKLHQVGGANPPVAARRRNATMCPSFTTS